MIENCLAILYPAHSDRSIHKSCCCYCYCLHLAHLSRLVPGCFAGLPEPIFCMGPLCRSSMSVCVPLDASHFRLCDAPHFFLGWLGLPNMTQSFLRGSRTEQQQQAFSKPPPSPSPLFCAVYTECFPPALWHTECLHEPALTVSVSLMPGTVPGTQRALRK